MSAVAQCNLRLCRMLGGKKNTLQDPTDCHQLAQTLPCLLPPQVSRHLKIMSSSFAANINPSESTRRPRPENKTERRDDLNWLLTPVTHLLPSLSHSLPAKWVSRQVCVCIISAIFPQFCYGKEWGISLWSFKAKYRETHVRDYRYIKEGWRIHYRAVSSSISPSNGLLLASFTEGGDATQDFECWKRTLKLTFNASQVFFLPPLMFNLIPCAVYYVNCNALFWKFGSGWSLFLCVMSLLSVVDGENSQNVE